MNYRAKIRKKIWAVGKYALAVLAACIVCFPVYYMVISSLMPNHLVMNLPIKWWPQEVTFANFSKIFQNSQYVNYFKNSFIVAFGCVAVVLLVSLPSSYALSRFRFRGKTAMLTAVTSVQMFPIVVIMISLYTLYYKWGLLDTYTGLILANTAFAMPLAITLLKGFYDTVSSSLDEAARIDGAGRLQVLLKILLPLILPGIVAVGTYTFLSAWDDYLLALIVMQKDANITLTVGLARSFLGEYSNDYGSLMAFSLAGSLPIVLMFAFFQKFLISGLTSGAVKG